MTVTGDALTSPVITSVTTANAQAGVPFAYRITATESPNNFEADSLPAGLVCNADTGLISGTPTVSGTFSVGLTAANPVGYGTANLTLTVAGTVVPVITSAVTDATVTGDAYRYQIVATNGPASFGAADLPSGLGIDATSGVISGTPTTAGVFNVTLSATNANGTGTTTLVLTVTAGLPTINFLAIVPHVTVGDGSQGRITLNRSGGDLTQKLIVHYSIKGSARNGTDYLALTGKQKFIRAHASADIMVAPENTFSGTSVRVVKVTLLPGAGYRVGPINQAKVKIYPADP